MMSRVKLWMAALGALALASPLAWGTAPRFRFEVGKPLTYHLNQTMALVIDGQEVMRANLQTTTVLEPRQVEPDGTAEIALTTTTTGRSVKFPEPALHLFPAPSKGPAFLTVTVSPDGRVTSLRGAAVKHYRFLIEAAQQTEAEAVWGQLVGTRLLFGLQLPEALPAVGATWQGETTQEAMATQNGKTERLYSRSPVTYTYKGVEQYQGHSCHVFTALGDFIPPSTYYFDAAAGQLVGWEQHVQDPMTIGLVLRLAPSGEGAPAPETSAAAPPTAAAPQPPVWKQANDWDITYRLLPSPDGYAGKSGTLRVRFRRPNLMRIDVTLCDSSTGTESYTAVLNADSVHIYPPQYPLAIWAPLNQHFPLLVHGLGNYGKVSPLPEVISRPEPEVVSPNLIAAAQRGEQALRLLPEEVVAGRPALVVESDPMGSLLPGAGWVDKEYGLPLAGRLTHGAEFRAQEVHINEGISDAVFAPDMPAGTVTFKGPLATYSALFLDAILKQDGGAREPRGRIPDTEPITTRCLLALPRLPAGFEGSILGLGVVVGENSWRLSTTFAARTGAVISFVEQTGLDDESLRAATAGLAPTAQQTSVTVHGRPATLYQHDRPYPGLILVWEEKGLRALLQASEVSAEELLAIAASVIPLELTAQKEVILPDLETAVSVLPAPVYMPTYLPSGAKLFRLTANWLHPAYQGLVFTATYALPQKGSLTIQQSWPAAGGFDATPGEQASTSGGEAQSLTWVPESRQAKFTISGPLGKDVMLKIAQSMKAVEAAKQ